MNLFDNRTSLKVNIWLRQFRLSHCEIIQLLREGRSKETGAEKLRGLLKILPQSEEVLVICLITLHINQIMDTLICSHEIYPCRPRFCGNGGNDIALYL